MKIAIYSRKSKFTGKGESIENQVEMCKDYICMKFDGISDSDIFVFEDEGFTGKNLMRPQFKKFIEQENINPFDYVVCYRLDRISRNIGDFATLIDDLNSKGTSFISIKEQFDTSTPMGRAMMNIAAVFAQLERETIAERVKDNMYMLAKDGRWTGGTAPLGYKSVKIINTNRDKNRSYYILEFDEKQLDLAKLIFKKYKEIHSIGGVQTYLNEHGYKTQKGNEWDKSNLKRILTNPIYCIADKDSYQYFNNLGSNVCFNLDDCDGKSGILPYNRFAGAKRINQSPDKWLITVSKHQGILSGEEWVDIQNIIKQNSKNSGNRRSLNPNSILSGVLHCSCGAYMRPKIYGSGNMYYMCERKEKTKLQECHIKNIKGDELDKLVLDELFAYNIENSPIYNQINSLKHRIASADNEISHQIGRLQKKKQDNEKAIENLVVALSMNVSGNTIQVVNSQINSITEENEKINLQISELSKTDMVKSELTNNLNSVLDALVYLKANFNKLSIENKRGLIKKIIEKVIWNGESVDIFIKGIL